jgi:hypothetical protein
VHSGTHFETSAHARLVTYYYLVSRIVASDHDRVAQLVLFATYFAPSKFAHPLVFCLVGTIIGSCIIIIMGT